MYLIVFYEKRFFAEFGQHAALHCHVPHSKAQLAVDYFLIIMIIS